MLNVLILWMSLLQFLHLFLLVLLEHYFLCQSHVLQRAEGQLGRLLSYDINIDLLMLSVFFYYFSHAPCFLSEDGGVLCIACCHAVARHTFYVRTRATLYVVPFVLTSLIRSCCFLAFFYLFSNIGQSGTAWTIVNVVFRRLRTRVPVVKRTLNVYVSDGVVRGD